MLKRTRILAIDLGSTSTRSVLFLPDTKEVIPVEPQTQAGTDYRFNPGDFKSTGYPFEQDNSRPVYYGQLSDHSRTPVSLKYAFYLLADCSDVLLNQYRLFDELLRMKDDPAFMARLRDGLRDLFSTIRTRVHAECERKGLVVTKMGLSIPAQWTMEFEDVYMEIVTGVFDMVPADQVYFPTETECLAHYLFMDYWYDLNTGGPYDMILFMDFGGHNMVSHLSPSDMVLVSDNRGSRTAVSSALCTARSRIASIPTILGT